MKGSQRTWDGYEPLKGTRCPVCGGALVMKHVRALTFHTDVTTGVRTVRHSDCAPVAIDHSGCETGRAA